MCLDKKILALDPVIIEIHKDLYIVTYRNGIMLHINYSMVKPLLSSHASFLARAATSINIFLHALFNLFKGISKRIK